MNIRCRLVFFFETTKTRQKQENSKYFRKYMRVREYKPKRENKVEFVYFFLIKFTLN